LLDFLTAIFSSSPTFFLYLSGKYPSFDYISVTPPYLEVNYSTLLDQLARSPLVGKDCFIVSFSCHVNITSCPYAHFWLHLCSLASWVPTENRYGWILWKSYEGGFVFCLDSFKSWFDILHSLLGPPDGCYSCSLISQTLQIADRRFGRTNLLIYGPTWSEKKRRTWDDFWSS
jgi:hypothetical protein